jgi:predicted anti-sigma-YlaC factor YlaD
MRNEHIIELLDSVPLKSLSETDLARIREHSVHCAACRQAFNAAQLSALVLRERARATIEPSPFFKTKVMAAIREQAAAGHYSLARLWKAAQTLVYSLAAVVVLLGAMTQWGLPDPNAGGTAIDSEWAALVADSSAKDEMSYDQVLSDIYDGSEKESSDGNRQ